MIGNRVGDPGRPVDELRRSMRLLGGTPARGPKRQLHHDAVSRLGHAHSAHTHFSFDLIRVHHLISLPHHLLLLLLLLLPLPFRLPLHQQQAHPAAHQDPPHHWGNPSDNPSDNPSKRSFKASILPLISFQMWEETAGAKQTNKNHDHTRSVSFSICFFFLFFVSYYYYYYCFFFLCFVFFFQVFTISFWWCFALSLNLSNCFWFFL